MTLKWPFPLQICKILDTSFILRDPILSLFSHFVQAGGDGVKGFGGGGSIMEFSFLQETFWPKLNPEFLIKKRVLTPVSKPFLPTSRRDFIGLLMPVSKPLLRKLLTKFRRDFRGALTPVSKPFLQKSAQFQGYSRQLNFYFPGILCLPLFLYS